MTDRRSPKGVPLLALKLNTGSVPQISQPSSSSSRDMPWEGNVGAKRFFLGTREGEGLSDEDLFKLFLQKEGELFTSKNSQTPFQYIKTTEELPKQEEKNKEASDPLHRVKEDSRDASYEAWAAQMTSLMLLRKEEQRSKQTQHVTPSTSAPPI